MVGRTLSHYKVLGEIGRGGMGIVYRALDLRLKREVAVKVLPSELVSDEDRKHRFVQEAQAAAALQHPNIAVVHEIDETDGVTFIVMELVHGEKLSELLRQGPLSLPRALRIAKQVARGLVCAHEKGIVHRDLKPANVMILGEDQVKIIDFGLAKLIEPIGKLSETMETEIRRQTNAGSLLGTYAYMSPEQTRGETVDHRSDIFSLGILFFEMISGRSPFERPTPAETLSAILRDPTPSLTSAAPAAPRRALKAASGILRRCLEKEPASRYQAASELAVALEALEVDVRDRRLAGGWTGRGLTAAVITGLVLSGTWWLTTRERALDRTPPRVLTILVADFDNRTGDTVFDGALEQALAIGLEGAPFITAYDRALARRQSAELSPGREGRLDEGTARLVCRSQGIDLALTGRIVPEGSGYLVRVNALDPITAESLAEASETVKDKTTVLRAVDRLASELRADLGDVNPTSSLAFGEETFTTASLEAMRSYAAAQEFLDSGNTENAIREYKKALSQDADFGRAYSGLAVAQLNLGRPEEAQQYFDKALSLLHKMSERERLRTRGVYYLHVRNYPKAIDEYTELVDKFPSDGAGFVNLALASFYTRDFRNALETGRRAADISPNDLLARGNLAIYATYVSDFETAIRESETVLEINPAYENAYVALALAHVANGEPEEADRVYHRLAEVSERGASLAAMGLSDLALYEGRLVDAESILTPALARDEERNDRFAAANKLTTLALVHAERGRFDAAVDAAERSLTQSDAVGILVRAASVFFLAGKPERALEIAAALESRDDADAKSYGILLRGEAALAKGETAQTIDLLRAASERADTWLSRMALGRAFLQAGAFVEASSELDACFRRRGEATALFLDDVPSYHVVPQLHYFLALSQEGLKSAGAADSYRAFLRIKGKGEKTGLVAEAERRLSALE